MNTEESKEGQANSTEKERKLPPHAYVRKETLRKGRETQEKLRMVGLKRSINWAEIERLAEAGRKAERDGTARSAGIALLLQVQECIQPLMLKERLACFGTFTKAARRKQALENIISLTDRAMKVAVALAGVTESEAKATVPAPPAPLTRTFGPKEQVMPAKNLPANGAVVDSGRPLS